MSNGRLDVVLRALDGPLANHGELRLKGPLVEIGAGPAPGGLAVPVRGLASVHVRISVRPDGQAEVVPVGTNQARVAPHAKVSWNRIDPVRGAVLLNQGGVMYLGPVGRGVTLELVRLEGMDWTAGRVGSTAADVASKAVSAGAAPARRAVRIAPATVGVGVVGCGFGVAAIALTVAVLIAFPPITRVDRLGPRIDGEELYEVAPLDESAWAREPAAQRGVAGAWERFVVRPSADAADAVGADTGDVLRPDSWDRTAFEYFVASGERHLGAWAFWRRLETAKEEYAQVLGELRRADLPEVLAAIPFTESRYRPRELSPVCARGWWQFMPEVAVRHGLQVSDCRITRVTGERVRWDPKPGSPARFKNAPYLDRTGPSPRCVLQCGIDEREELVASTRAAIADLRVAWDDEELRQSGAAVMTTILSHNAGYDDSRFGRARRTNVLPAYRAWSRTRGLQPTHHFYGANLTCPEDRQARGTCGGHVPAEAQRYGFTVVAQHWLAACYYGQNHATGELASAFETYQQAALADDGFCHLVDVPRPSDL